MSFEKLLGLESDDESQKSTTSFKDDLETEEHNARAGGISSTRTNSDSDSDMSSEDNEVEATANPLDIISMNEPMKLNKPLNEAALKKFQARIDKTGVVYLSRIPPFMKHTKLRSLLSQYAEILRIYLNPEDPKITARRKKYKKNKRQNYVEGWVEFADKKVAKLVAAKLNNNPIGGKKRSYYHDDIWNMKYLPKFKWNNLSEQLAYELKVREQKIRAEMAQAKRENSLFLKNVSQSKMIKAMEEKKRKLNSEEIDSNNEGNSVIKKKKPNRQFKQRKPAEMPKMSSTTLLSKMFS